ncbi:M96 mating-specific protein family [Phytophthora nicotianae]|nr:M96 mating-specific protein family [Phytophthora nicotianae]
MAEDPGENELQNTLPDDERLRDGGVYEGATPLPIVELQAFFRGKTKKRWSYMHTNAMAIAFMLDPTTDLDDLIGSDSRNVDSQVREMSKRCGLTSITNDPKLTAEILDSNAKNETEEKHSVKSTLNQARVTTGMQ